MAILRGGAHFLRPFLQPVTHHCLPSQLLFSRKIASKVFVGGLSFYTTENALSEAFSQFGQVIEDEAQRAITEMNGKVLNGRIIFVDTAKSKARFDDGGRPVARGPPSLLNDD
ncbi:glycine-rich RNA-binding protein 4, mitochondrial isoform X2 [Amborella trichopoda]|uniref:glycine-rich RNA-binding protein 4, mitochondrial isoform X2 n=1 Tax=Amborella trichopoda TaxID=13333 RepID=UPI0005D396CD|nr:glycine-rich RNA-binding protein 4, mitochondrial isoform X2 [Amborella trichopoda]|eukprot:XP_011620656.1 glycine-rich RNA-binding protein 4, mitochondrial isoform X2 [Amborella trichopoda]